MDVHGLAAEAHHVAADAARLADMGRLKQAQAAHNQASELYAQAAQQAPDESIASFLQLSANNHKTQSLILQRRLHYHTEAQESRPLLPVHSNSPEHNGVGVADSFLLVQAPGMSVYQMMSPGKHGPQQQQQGASCNSRECARLRQDLQAVQRQLAQVSTANAQLRLQLTEKDKESTARLATIRALRRAVRARLLPENVQWDGTAAALEDESRPLRESVTLLRRAVAAKQRAVSRSLHQDREQLSQENQAAMQTLSDLRKSIAVMDLDSRPVSALRAERHRIREGVAELERVVDVLDNSTVAPASPTRMRIGRPRPMTNIPHIVEEDEGQSAFVLNRQLSGSSPGSSSARRRVRFGDVNAHATTGPKLGSEPVLKQAWQAQELGQRQQAECPTQGKESGEDEQQCAAGSDDTGAACATSTPERPSAPVQQETEGGTPDEPGAATASLSSSAPTPASKQQNPIQRRVLRRSRASTGSDSSQPSAMVLEMLQGPSLNESYEDRSSVIASLLQASDSDDSDLD